MSSRGSEMKEVYDSLIDILTNNREHFEDTSYSREKEIEREDEIYSCNTRCCLKDDCECDEECEEED